MSVPDLLARVPLFQDLTPREFEMLRSVLRSRRLEPGALLFEEGARGAACFVVLHGDVTVSKRLASGADHELARLGPGALIGEMSLIDGKTRSASCRGGTQPVFLIELHRPEFERLFNANNRFAFKILERIALGLAARLREVTARLTEVRASDLDEHTEEARACAQAAAEALGGQGTFKIEVDFEDSALDEITFEIPEGAQRPAPRPGR